MIKFHEYLDVKGKEQDKPIISVDGDTAADPAINPYPFATKGKNWKDDAALPGKQKPYMAKASSAKEGFGYAGDKDLIYTPDTIESEYDKDYVSFPKEKSSTVWKMEGFINKTKDMSLPEFTSFLKNSLMIDESTDIPKIYAFEEGEILPDPCQAIRYASFIANANAKLMEMLVMEIKKNNNLEGLISEILRYNDGRAIIQEMTSEPIEKEEEDLSKKLEKSIDKKKKKKEKEAQQPQDVNAEV